MAFKEGDFLEVDYSAWDAATNELIATTNEKMARDADLHEKGTIYGPSLVILGSNSVIKGLDRELRNMSVGDQKRFTFKPDDAFGNRMEELVRVMPLSDFRAKEIDPHPGMRIEIENTVATIKSVNSGRVVVDANHPYAGRDIVYEVKVVRNITDEKAKIEALGRSYGAKPTSVSVHDKVVEIGYDSKFKKSADYFIGKTNLVASVLTMMKDFDKVEVKEEYDKAEMTRQANPETAEEGKSKE